MLAHKDLINLSGKTAIVTGGAKGIGFGISYRLAEAGAHVLIADLDEAAAQKSVDELTAKGWSVKALKVDVSQEADIKNMVQTAVSTYGSLDIMVNNAGIYPNQPIAVMKTTDFEKVLHVNLLSVFMTTKYASEVMKQHGGGKIINVTSIDALHPSMIGLAHYDSSKHGLWGFTKNAALELSKDNITVNAVAPGGIVTPGTSAGSGGLSAEQMKAATAAFLAKIPMHRMGEADEIGKVVLFLASDMASYMTGSQIVADGGALLS